MYLSSLRTLKLSLFGLMSLSMVTACAGGQNPVPPTQAQSQNQCSDDALDVVILGSGGPELSDKRASTGYLVRENGKARFIIDFGAGASLNFERAGGQIEDLYAVLFTHFHVDHSNDLPALVKASFFSERTQDLPIYGPTGNHVIPSTPDFIEKQFGEQGVYPYLSDFLSGDASFALKPIAVDANLDKPRSFSTQLKGFTIKAVPISHGLLPSVAWRIEKNGCSVVISGDTSNQGRTLDDLVKDSNVFIAHNAVPEHSHDTVATHLHMTPSEIGRIAGLGTQSLVLSHFMRRTQNHDDSKKAIGEHYQGKVYFANDCDIYSLKSAKKVGQCSF